MGEVVCQMAKTTNEDGISEFSAVPTVLALWNSPEADEKSGGSEKA